VRERRATKVTLLTHPLKIETGINTSQKLKLPLLYVAFLNRSGSGKACASRC
jgi:hypothetical protein